MTLGDLTPGTLAVVTESTLCSGTMHDLHLAAGTPIKVAWHLDETTFVDVLDGPMKTTGTRRGPRPCPKNSPVAIDLASAVTGASEDATRDQQQSPKPLDAPGPRTRQERIEDEQRERLSAPAQAAGEEAAKAAAAPTPAGGPPTRGARTSRSQASGDGRDRPSPQARRARARRSGG